MFPIVTAFNALSDLVHNRVVDFSDRTMPKQSRVNKSLMCSVGIKIGKIVKKKMNPIEDS